MTDAQKRWWKENQHRLQKYRKASDLKKKYGISLETYNQMLVEQQACCYVCKQPETQLNPKSTLPYSLAVDHCHKTGQVRRLLCSRCNRTLGMVDDDITLLEKLMKYIKECKETN